MSVTVITSVTQIAEPEGRITFSTEYITVPLSGASSGPSSASATPSSSSDSITTSSSSSSIQTNGQQVTPPSLPVASTSATATSSVSGSSSATSGASSASAAGAGSSTSSAAAVSSSSSSSNTGLIAGVAVLAVLLALALGIIGFLLFRRSRRNNNTSASHGREVSEVAGAGAGAGALAGASSSSRRGGRGNNNTISANEIEASLLAGGGAGAIPLLDDKQADGKFARLNHDINDWVLHHFRHVAPRPSNLSQSPEALQAVRGQPYYQSLLQDSRGKFLVIRGIVADQITEAFDSGEIIGLSDVFGMEERFPSNVGAREKANWRASTVVLLEKDAGFGERQASAIEAIAQRINASVSAIVGVDSGDQSRLRQLGAIVQSAAGLALELAKQRVNFELLHPSEDAFDPAIMEDVLQESKAASLRGRRVLSVVFPAVVRYGDDSGAAFDRRHVVRRAHVLAEGGEAHDLAM